MDYQDLITNLNIANARYYQGSPIMSDKEYDSLYEQLQQIESQSPELISPSSPTQRVGSDLTTTSIKIPHKKPMLSMRNAYDKESFKKWLDKVNKKYHDGTYLNISFKVDGIAASIFYKNGHYDYAVTRGNGIVGEDITANVKTIRNLPLFVSGLTGEVRGEIYCSKLNFNKYNEKLKLECEENGKKFTPFSNARNFTTGSIKQHSPELCSQRRLSFIVHSLGDCNATNLSGWYRDCLGNNFEVVTYKLCNSREEDRLWRLIEIFDKDRNHLHYDCDGVVVSLDSVMQREELGTSAKHPHWIIACKLYNDDVETKLLDIEYTVGDTGVVTPTAVFEPVELLGSTISRACISNKSVMDELDLCEGDSILVEKAGMIIPKIKKVLKEKRVSENRFKFPTHCPNCGNLLKQEEGKKKIFCEHCVKN